MKAVVPASPSASVTSSIESVPGTGGAASLLVITPLPWPSTTVAPVTLVTLTKKLLVGLERRVAVDGDVESISAAARRNGLAGQADRDIVVVFGCRVVVLRGAVGGGDVEGDAAGPAGALRLTVKV